MSEPKMTIRDASMLRCPTCSGSGLVPRHTHKELDRLRAEIAKLKDTIQFVRTFVEGRAILAKTAKEGG